MGVGVTCQNQMGLILCFNMSLIMYMYCISSSKTEIELKFRLTNKSSQTKQVQAFEPYDKFKFKHNL